MREARVDGMVTVRVHEKTQCKGLNLQIGWRTTGYGNSSGHVGFEQLLFAGQWAPGEYRYNFNVMAPHGPYTYRGHHINVDWYAKVTADVPWARDPSVEQHFGVRPTTTPLPPTHAMTSARDEEDVIAVEALVAGVMVLSVLIVVVLAGAVGNAIIAAITGGGGMLFGG